MSSGNQRAVKGMREVCAVTEFTFLALGHVPFTNKMAIGALFSRVDSVVVSRFWRSPIAALEKGGIYSTTLGCMYNNMARARHAMFLKSENGGV